MAFTTSAGLRWTSVGPVITGLILIALLPAFVITWWISSSARDDVIRRAYDRLEDTAWLGSALHGQMLLAVERALVLEPVLVALAVTDVEACAQLLRDKVVSHPFILSALIVSRSGTVLCASNGRGIGTDLSDRDYIAWARRQDSLAVGEPLVARTNGRLVLPAARRIGPAAALEGRGDEPAVVAAALDLDGLARRIGVSLGERDPLAASASEVLLIDRNERILAAWPEPDRRGATVSLETLAVGGRKGSVAVVDPSGDVRLASVGPMLSGGIRAVVSEPLAQVTRFADRRFAQMLLLMGGVALFGGIIATVTARRMIVTPLRALTRSVEAFEQGAAAASLPPGRMVGELETLRRAFERMVQEVMRRESSLQEANAQLADLAQRDPLTGVANRRAFEAALAQAWERGRRSGEPIGLVLIDVDHFKAFNDTYGHLEGDRCLARVAAALAALPLRPNDLVARLGGEEFVILLPGTDTAGAATVGERARSAVADLLLLHEGSTTGFVTISVGAASAVPARLGAAKSLVAAADRAAYAAKAGGRNRVIVDGSASAAVSSVDLAAL